MGMIRLQKVWRWGLMKIWLLKAKKDHHLSKVKSLNQLFLMWEGVQSPPWISASINITIFYASWWEHHGTNWWNGIGVKGYSHQRDWPWSNKGHLEIVEGYDKKIQTFYFLCCIRCIFHFLSLNNVGQRLALNLYSLKRPLVTISPLLQLWNLSTSGLSHK